MKTDEYHFRFNRRNNEGILFNTLGEGCEGGQSIIFKQLWQIVEIYLTRWKCDECYRYIKKSYNMEDFKVLGYNSIHNITVLVHAIAYFTSIYLGISIKLRIMVQKIFILSKRFFGVPSFYNYAMADGIFELLRHSKQGLTGFKSIIGPHHDTFQLSLYPD